MKKIITIGVLIIVLLLIAFLGGKVQEKVVPKDVVPEEEEMITETLVVKHQYQNGKHVFVGEVELPSTCYSYNAYIKASDDENTKILQIDRTTEGEVCGERFEIATYKVVYEGPEDLRFRAFINDQEYRLNAFDIPLDQNIDDFQIFLKG